MTTTFLRKISITYLLLPNLLFGFGWFRGPYSYMLIAGFLYLLFREFKKDGTFESFDFKELSFLLIFALIWTFFSGAGGLSDQKSDFFAHNAKFYDLYKNPWPTYFFEVQRYACYYFGYYLVPSFLAKITGELNPLIIYGWSAVGYFLGLTWVYLLINRSKLGIFAFFWVRGIGYILYLFFQKSHLLHIPLYRPVINGMIQHSNYVPNQFIGTLIVTCILVHDLFIRKQIKEAAFPITLIFIWGIFPSISLTIIYIILFFEFYFVRRRLGELWNWESVSNFLLPILLLLPTLGYFLSANSTTVKGFLWEFDTPIRAVTYYIIGIGFDLLIYYYLLRSLRHQDQLIPFWFINTLFVVLILLSFYRIGFHNDWFYRTQIPIFIIVIIVLLRNAGSYFRERHLPKNWILRSLTLVVVSMMLIQMTSYVHLLRDNVIIKSLFPKATSFKPMPYDVFPNVYQLMKKVYKNRGDAEQYLADKDSFYEKHLARKVEMKEPIDSPVQK